jgi:hypothetical protein
MARVLHLVGRAAERRVKYNWSWQQSRLAFQLVCQLANPATAACEKSEAKRMGAQLMRIIEADDLSLMLMADMLAQAAAVLDSEDIDSSIVSLIQARGSRNVGSCIDLVTTSCGFEERQRRFLSALMTAVGQAGSGGQLLSSISRWQVLALARVLLNGKPGESTVSRAVQP